jgi:hypothetical protein
MICDGGQVSPIIKSIILKFEIYIINMIRKQTHYHQGGINYDGQ